MGRAYLELAEVAVEAGRLGTFAIELPTHRAVEEEMRSSARDPLHIDVHYLDEVTAARHRDLIEPELPLLAACGLVAFGFARRDAIDEVWVDVYKTITVRCEEPARYVSCLNRLGVPRAERLRTAWDTLSQDTPGHRLQVERDGRTIYDLVRRFEREHGLWFARRRPDE